MNENENRQVRKTRAALLEAFGGLVIEQSYGTIRVADIIRRADVGRSTFYEHFHDKDDVLRQSMSRLLTPMADAVADDWSAERLEFVLEHFQDNRRVALALLNGESFRDVQAWLAELIERRLTKAAEDSKQRLRIPARLAGAQIAGSQLGLIGAWLANGAGATSAEIARATYLASRASLEALFSE
jgi:AcrR family transcriptional regulator